MHDIDRTIQEVEEYFKEEEGFEETGFEEEFDSQSEFYPQYEERVSFTEEEEISLASELLSISSDRELDHFLGGFLKKIRNSGAFKNLGGILKKVAKVALPIAGKAAGAFFGGPVGASIGGSLGKAASSMFEINTEGMTAEEQDFEVARRFIRFANAASTAVARIPDGKANDSTVKQVVKDVAKKHAPGLFRTQPTSRYYGGQSGRWVRRGNKVILYGIG